MTFLFEDIIFGPVKSRRLGISLGVNLLPVSAKLCNFNCIYCECGWTVRGGAPRFNAREDVARLLREKLQTCTPDVITFAGNGEPTMHPEFEEIIGDTIALRDELCPSAKVSVLSNATMIGRENVRRALLRVDNNILKLDSAFDSSVKKIDDPQGAYSVARVIENMKLFEGRLIIQTMFLRGPGVDNTTEREVSAWLDIVREVAPRSVMIYTIDRDTPSPDLAKIPVFELEKIASRVRELGIECSVAG